MCNVRESLANIGVCHCAARHENSRANITISHVLLTDRRLIEARKIRSRK